LIHENRKEGRVCADLVVDLGVGEAQRTFPIACIFSVSKFPVAERMWNKVPEFEEEPKAVKRSSKKAGQYSRIARHCQGPFRVCGYRFKMR
jgi:hypothetical protein